MKRIIFLLITVISFGTAFGQFNLGIKAGYNSSLSIDNIESVTTGTYTINSMKGDLSNGFHAGVFGRINMGTLYIQPEILYFMEKSTAQFEVKENTSIGETINQNITVNSLDIPLLVGLNVLNFDAFKLRAFAGPKFRFDVGTKINFSDNFEELVDASKIKKYQMGLEAGLGIDLLMFTLDFRYNLIGNMYETKISDIDFSNLSSNKFVISLGWKLF